MRSLVLTSLDLGRVLADKDGVTFRAKGTCMYPAIRPGDLLIIQSASVADIVVGDIAVCRSADLLFGHRVIDKGEDKGRAYIITKSDRSRDGNDPPTFDDDLLGVVRKIRRNKEIRQIQQTSYPKVIAHYHQACAVIIDLLDSLSYHSRHLAASYAGNLFYSIISRTWFAIVRPRLAYFVRVPLNETLGDSVYRNIKLDVFNPELLKTQQRWMLALHVNGTREPDAWVSFIRDPSGGWCIKEASARIRYRGTDLEKKLMIKAEAFIDSINP